MPRRSATKTMDMNLNVKTMLDGSTRRRYPSSWAFPVFLLIMIGVLFALSYSDANRAQWAPPLLAISAVFLLCAFLIWRTHIEIDDSNRLRYVSFAVRQAPIPVRDIIRISKCAT